MATALHVSISAETIFKAGPLEISNSMFSGVVVSFLLITFAVLASSQLKKTKTISRFQVLVELLVEGVYNLTKDIAGEKKARDFLPLIFSAIIFIAVNNWFGLLPGVGTIGLNYDPTEPENHAKLPRITQAQASEEIISLEDDQPESLIVGQEVDALEEVHEEEPHQIFIPLFRAATADLNTTLALALISVILTQVYGVKYLGLSYFGKFFNLKDGPIFTFVGILELISEFAKIISFAFRLFGNVFAGEVLLAVIAWLSGYFFFVPLPFIFLEIFVGFVQALVFAMLTLVFINMATTSHDH